MTELQVDPAFNNFVHKPLFDEARLLLDHINGALEKWDLASYKLTGESIPFVVAAVQTFIKEMHHSTEQQSFIFEDKFIEERTEDERRADADLTMKDFICSTLKEQFMSRAPRNVFLMDTLKLEPAVKILTLQLLEKSLERQKRVLGGLSQGYQDAFHASEESISYPAAYSFVHAVGQIFVRVKKPLELSGHAKVFDRLLRDFYCGNLPTSLSVEPKTISDQIFIELQSRLAEISNAARSKPPYGYGANNNDKI